MCGITTLIKRDEKVDCDSFKHLTRLLYSRGPDEEGFYFDDNVALGHRRLSIIDLHSGKQPIFNESDTVGVVFNGEIYNFRDEKKNLENKGHIFRTNTDTEVLVHLFEEYKNRLSEHIEGMFAFCIYDKENRSIIISRDQFGKKPLYYYLDDSVLAIASEMKVLLQIPEIKRNIKIDNTSLTKYLFYGYVPSPHTIYDKIKKLEPSTTMQFQIDEWKFIHKYQYWDLPSKNIESNNLTENEILEKLDDLIKKAVKKRLIADVPLGALLSGGVDSSLVCGVAKKFKQNLKTYTVQYSEKDIDESEYAKNVADYIGANRNFCSFSENDVPQTFDDILSYMDEPIADAAIIPTYFVSKFARKDVKVILSGDGGDELFGGYSKYGAQFIAEKINRILPKEALIFIEFFVKCGLKVVPISKSKKDTYIKFISSLKYDFPIRNFLWGSGSFSPNEVIKLLRLHNLNLRDVFSDAFDYDKEIRHDDSINRALYLDSRIQLPDWYLMKTDRASMANSLEMRNPLLDKDLAEFIFTIPGKHKMQNGESKYLLKKLATRYVPRNVIYRQKKGFGVPLNKWIQGELKEIFWEKLNSKRCEVYFDKNFVLELWDNHISGKEDNAFKLLRVVNFLYFVDNVQKMIPDGK